MSVCECCINAKNIHSYLLSWRDCYIKKTKNQINNVQNRRTGEIENRILETYTKSVMRHGHHIYKTASSIDMETMCAYPPYQHALPHCKCVLRCCANFPRIDLPSQHLDNHQPNTCTTINVHVYHLI